MRTFVAAGILLAMAGTVVAQQDLKHWPADTAQPVPLAMDGVSLEELTEQVAARTGKRILLEDHLQKVKVYARSPRKVAPPDLFRFYLSALELNGFALAPAGGPPGEVFQLTESRNMRRMEVQGLAAEDLRKNAALLPADDSFVMVTCPLRHGRAREITNGIRPLTDPNAGGQIVSGTDSSLIVVADFAPNAGHLVSLIERLDIPARRLACEVLSLRWTRSSAAAAEARKRLPDPTGLVWVPLDEIPGANAVLLWGPAEAVARAADALRSLDVGPGSPPPLATVPPVRAAGTKRAASPPSGAVARPDPGPPLELNLEDGVPFEKVIELMASSTGKTFLYQDRVRIVRLIAKGRRPLASGDLFSFGRALLEQQGFALASVNPGTPAELLKVVEARNMRRYPVPLLDAEEIRRDPGLLPTGDERVLVTCRLRHASARETSNALRPLTDPNHGGQIMGFDGCEVVVIADRASAVRKLLEAVEGMDVPGAPPVWEAIPLSWAHAGAVIAAVREQFGWAAAPPEDPMDVTLLPVLDPPGANGVVLIGERAQVAAVAQIVRKLDARPAREAELPSEGKGK